MSVIFCGGEIEDFGITGAVAFSSSVSNAFRPAYARGYLDIPGGAFGAILARASFPASAAVGVAGRVYPGAVGITAGQPFFWLATGGGARLRLKANTAHPSTISLESYTSGGVATTLATSTGTITIAAAYRIDILCDYQEAGRFRLWVDNSLFIDYSGDLRASGATTLDSVNFGNFRTTGTSCGSWSEIVVTDGEDPRPLSLKTLQPNGAGDASGWSGGFAEVDEITASDADVISSATAGQVTNFDCTGMPTGGGGLSVRMVKVTTSALRGAAGPSKLQLGVKSGSVEGWSADRALDTGYTSVSNTWTINPATGAAFTAAEIDALKLAVKSVA